MSHLPADFWTEHAVRYLWNDELRGGGHPVGQLIIGALLAEGRADVCDESLAVLDRCVAPWLRQLAEHARGLGLLTSEALHPAQEARP